ncbi:MAG: hypothetical protein M1816_007933 [Peltula sp. TS41687]|nr:MAG: hypothetical protein M1816_007933 [Peltula sp. TS41687]
MSEDQATPVDDIALDDQKLEEKASQLYGEDPVKDPTETAGRDFEIVDDSVCAILIRKDGGAGAVSGITSRNIMTGPKQGAGFVMIVIRTGRTCMFLGNPSVRYFRRRNL